MQTKRCALCGKRGPEISQTLQVCPDCIRNNWDEAVPHVLAAHRKTRISSSLPAQPPKTSRGIPCGLCSNECLMGDGERGYCGLRKNDQGQLETLADSDTALIHSYLDAHVTNCCSSWFCPPATGMGYPDYAYSSECERGYYNYSVFFYGCNFNCLFCQNFSHKNLNEGKATTVDQFVADVKSKPKCSCICYFGGSPEPQLPFAINASERLVEESPDRILRICFEWNGCGNPELVRKVAELSYLSGGNIKFDLKCFNTNLSVALSGVPNNAAFHNFELIADEFYDRRPKPPVLTATTLLVPGYVDETEVDLIARFISDLSPEIPYSLLLFHPNFYMSDMHFTSRHQMEKCLQAANRHLRNVHVGNIGLLGM